MIATTAETLTPPPATTDPARPGLDAAQQRALREDGFVVLRNVIEPALISGLRGVFAEVCERMLHELARAGEIGDTMPGLPLERRLAVAAGPLAARFGRSWRQEIASRELFALQHCPRLVDAMQAWFGGDGVLGHPVYNARPKLPDQQLTVVPWHQDSSYFGAATARQLIATAWIPLVVVDADNGCMQLAAGSHRYGLAPHHVEERAGAFLEITGGDPSADVLVTCAMVPGDALIFDNLMWHRSLENRSADIRWSVDLRYYPEADAALGPGDYPEPWVIRSATGEPTPLARWLAWNGR